MSTIQKEPTMAVVYLDDWNQIGRRTSAGHWFVLRRMEGPQERSIAAYANLMGERNLFRKGASTGIETVIEGIGRGFQIGSVDRIKGLLGINRQALSRLLDVSPRTLSRRSKLDSSASERLLRLGSLFQKALEVLGEREAARHWFTTPKKALGGKSPLEFAETEVGAREVEDLLGRIEYGVFS